MKLPIYHNNNTSYIYDTETDKYHLQNDDEPSLKNLKDEEIQFLNEKIVILGNFPN